MFQNKKEDDILIEALIIYIYEFSCISNFLIVKMFILCFDPLKPNSNPNYVFTSLHQNGNNKNKAVMVSFLKKNIDERMLS